MSDGMGCDAYEPGDEAGGRRQCSGVQRNAAQRNQTADSLPVVAHCGKLVRFVPGFLLVLAAESVTKVRDIYKDFTNFVEFSFFLNFTEPESIEVPFSFI